MKYSVIGDWQEASGQIEFKGTLDTPWTMPFGWKWINIEAGSTVDLKLGTDVTFQLTFSGKCQLAWLFGMSTDVVISVGGPEMSDVVFAISNFPISKLTLNVLCQYITGKTPPAILNGLNPMGTAGVSIATYDSSFGKNDTV